jgi:DNA (cytosine-5)-methyltransferase 1
MKILDLFSGIGGFSLGMESTGHFETVKFVEMDKYCQKVLRKHWPNVPIEEDIKNVKGKEFEADVIVGGFPCQPMSVAGRQKGTSDSRYLWPEMFRLIREVKPEFVIGENVQGIINIQDGMVLRQVQDDLESEGFEVQCFLIPASGIGAWHQRNRVWIVGHSEYNGSLATKKSRGNTETTTGTSQGKKETIELERTSGSRNNENVPNTKSQRTRENNERLRPRISGVSRGKRTSRTEEDVSNTESIRSRECGHTDQEKGMGESSFAQSNCPCTNVSNSNCRMCGGRRAIGPSGTNQVWGFYPEKEKQTEHDVRSETIGRNVVPGEEEINQHTNDQRQQEPNLLREPEEPILDHRRHDEGGRSESWWTTQSRICRIPDGISYELHKDRVNRVKALGNAIVPQIARQLALAMLAAKGKI